MRKKASFCLFAQARAERHVVGLEHALAERVGVVPPAASIRPFCKQPTVTSTFHASCGKSTEPSEEIVSTGSGAGWPTLSIAPRVSPIRLAMPVEVSLCTAITALMACVASRDSLASIAAGSAPWG